jgi:hypothetical protein
MLYYTVWPMLKCFFILISYLTDKGPSSPMVIMVTGCASLTNTKVFRIQGDTVKGKCKSLKHCEGDRSITGRNLEFRPLYKPRIYFQWSEHRQSCWITAARSDPVTSRLHVVDCEDYRMEDMQGGNDSGSQFWTYNGTKVRTNMQQNRTSSATYDVRQT